MRRLLPDLKEQVRVGPSVSQVDARRRRRLEPSSRAAVQESRGVSLGAALCAEDEKDGLWRLKRGVSVRSSSGSHSSFIHA